MSLAISKEEPKEKFWDLFIRSFKIKEGIKGKFFEISQKIKGWRFVKNFTFVTSLKYFANKIFSVGYNPTELLLGNPACKRKKFENFMRI